MQGAEEIYFYTFDISSKSRVYSMFVPTAVLFVKRAQKRRRRRVREEEEESKSCKSFFSSFSPKKVKGGELHICESDLLEATIIKYSSLRL